MDLPTVSVGMPVYNSEGILRRALDSLCAQTYEQLEIVICDNASTDRTAEICQEYAARDSRVKYFRNHRNIGPIRNFRRVVELARGKYFTWTAADDERPVRALEECVKALEGSPAAVMAHGPIEARLPEPASSVLIRNRMNLRGSRAHERVTAFTRGLEHNGMLYGVYRRDALATSFLGDHFGHDYLFCLRICLLGPIAYTESPIITYQQRSAAIESPMYTWVPVNLRDLLFYRGVRRNKCWLTLVLGCYYLLTEPTAHVATKIRAAMAHVRSFVGRYGVHLVSECVFIAFTPLYWAVSPFRQVGLRAVDALRRRGLVSPATHL